MHACQAGLVLEPRFLGRDIGLQELHLPLLSPNPFGKHGVL